MPNEIEGLDSPEIIDMLPDGGAMVYDEANPPAADNHFENLADGALDDVELEELGLELSRLVEQDVEDRKERDEMYARGLERTGIGTDAPGGASFQGATKVTHPVLAEASVDCAARILRELLPATPWFVANLPDVEEPDPKAQQAAEKKASALDEICKNTVREFRAELEQLIGQEVLAGSQYFRVWPDRRLKRARCRFVPIDDVILPSSAASYATATRRTTREKVTAIELKRRVESGQYRDVELVAPSNPPSQTRPDEVVDRAQGVSAPVDNEDEVFTLYEVEVALQLESLGDETEMSYLVTYEETSSAVLSVYRNWDPDDPLGEPIIHAIEFPFLPWRGAYSIGLLHAIGGLAGAATGALRALLDSAHINNMATGVSLPGSGRSGESVNLRPTEIKTLGNNVASDDIRKVFMPMPFNPPSPVLFQLLGFVIEAAKGMVRATVEGEEEGQANVPVGTTLARIDEGTVVFGSIHARQVRAFLEAGKLIGRVMSEVDPRRYGMLRDLSDVAPAADPSVYTEAKRLGQIQAMQARDLQLKSVGIQLYDTRKLEERFLRQLKVPNYQEILAKEKKPQRMDAVSENVAATMAQPVVAFPDQDHESHLKIHVPYIDSIGKLPMVSPGLYPGMLEHLKQHVALWYAQVVYDVASRAAGRALEELTDQKDTQISVEVDRLMAMAAGRALTFINLKLQQLQVERVVGEMMKFLQAMQPQMAGDPALMAEVKRKAEADKLRKDTDDRKLQLAATDGARKAAEAEKKAALEAEQRRIEQENENAREAMRRQTTLETTAAELATREAVNTQDNETALEIAENRDAKTGTDQNPGG